MKVSGIVFSRLYDTIRNIKWSSFFVEFLLSIIIIIVSKIMQTPMEACLVNQHKVLALQGYKDAEPDKRDWTENFDLRI